MSINMKYTTLLLLVFASFFASAQSSVDSTRLLDTIILKKDFVDYVTGVVGERSGANYFKFYKQTTKQVDTAHLVNPDQLITIYAEGGFILEFYQNVSNVKEGVGSKINNDIKYALFPQLKNGWLINRLIDYNEVLNRELEAIKQRGRDIQKAYK